MIYRGYLICTCSITSGINPADEVPHELFDVCNGTQGVLNTVSSTQHENVNIQITFGSPSASVRESESRLRLSKSTFAVAPASVNSGTSPSSMLNHTGTAGTVFCWIGSKNDRSERFTKNNDTSLRVASRPCYTRASKKPKCSHGHLTRTMRAWLTTTLFLSTAAATTAAAASEFSPTHVASAPAARTRRLKNNSGNHERNAVLGGDVEVTVRRARPLARGREEWGWGWAGPKAASGITDGARKKVAKTLGGRTHSSTLRTTPTELIRGAKVLSMIEVWGVERVLLLFSCHMVRFHMIRFRRTGCLDGAARNVRGKAGSSIARRYSMMLIHV